MPKFRKKPVVIEAFQMTKETYWDWDKWPTWVQDACASGRAGGKAFRERPGTTCEPGRGSSQLVCRTPEGDHRLEWGDWLIRSGKDEVCPCKPGIFEQTYECVGGTGDT